MTQRASSSATQTSRFFCSSHFRRRRDLLQFVTSSYSPQNHQAKAFSSANLSRRQLSIRHDFLPLRPCLSFASSSPAPRATELCSRFRRGEGSVNSKSKLSSSTIETTMKLLFTQSKLQATVRAPSKSSSPPLQSAPTLRPPANHTRAHSQSISVQSTTVDSDHQNHHDILSQREVDELRSTTWRRKLGRVKEKTTEIELGLGSSGSQMRTKKHDEEEL
uniref:Uncharacterized protein n=1 Tax=Brassica campestris TaxID=3711 RepID=M4EXG3_BRACM